MDELEFYNGAYTGPQVDSALGKATNNFTSIYQTSPTCTRGVGINAGQFFYLDDVLCKATKAITQGQTFTSGTNYTTVSVSGLDEVKASTSVADANDANTNGWYAAGRTASNLPVAEPCIIFVGKRSDFIVQEAWTADNKKKYHRFFYGSAWTNWVNEY